MLKFSPMNDATVRPFHVRAGKSRLRYPAHFNVLSGGLLGNVWGSGWRRWWWPRKIDLLSVPFSSKIIFFIPISRCFSIIFLRQMDKLWLRSPEGIAQVANSRRHYFGSCLSTLWMRGRSCMFLVPPVGSVFVCADLRLLCCSCFGSVSPVQLVFSFCCGCWWILVSICECAAGL